MLAEFKMQMALPKGCPTLQHMHSKKYSRPDNFFNTPGLTDLITKCEVDSQSRPPATDHFPIVTNILLPQEKVNTPLSFNFREADWEEYREKLKPKLARLPDKPVIMNTAQLSSAIGDLTLALQETTKEVIKRNKDCPDTKQWWNRELIKMKKELNRLRSSSYTYRAIANHPSHSELKQKSNRYGEAIVQAKRSHWTNYLEEMTANEMWTANKYIKEPIGNGGSPRIPTLRTTDEAGAEALISSNEEKARTFAKIFFPLPPLEDHNRSEERRVGKECSS